MILHKLIRYRRLKDYRAFSDLQAEDSIRWLKQSGIVLGQETYSLDLGCGDGSFGRALVRHGCPVTFADTENHLAPDLEGQSFQRFVIGRDQPFDLGEHDLVIFSNVLEHLEKPHDFLCRMHETMKIGGHLYLSWTNWLSPYGGHEFTPFHYLGPNLGRRLFDRLFPGKRGVGILVPTYIGDILNHIRHLPRVEIIQATPRYYTELPWIIRLPILREFLAWNCVLLLRRVI